MLFDLPNVICGIYFIFFFRCVGRILLYILSCKSIIFFYLSTQFKNIKLSSDKDNPLNFTLNFFVSFINSLSFIYKFSLLILSVNGNTSVICGGTSIYNLSYFSLIFCISSILLNFGKIKISLFKIIT